MDSPQAGPLPHPNQRRLPSHRLGRGPRATTTSEACGLTGHDLDVQLPGASDRQQFPIVAQKHDGLAVGFVGPRRGLGRTGDLLSRFGIRVRILEQPQLEDLLQQKRYRRSEVRFLQQVLVDRIQQPLGTVLSEKRVTPACTALANRCGVVSFSTPKALLVRTPVSVLTYPLIPIRPRSSRVSSVML